MRQNQFIRSQAQEKHHKWEKWRLITIVVKFGVFGRYCGQQDKNKIGGREYPIRSNIWSYQPPDKARPIMLPIKQQKKDLPQDQER